MLVSTGNKTDHGSVCMNGSEVFLLNVDSDSLALGGVYRYQYGKNGTIQYQWGEKEEN